MDSFGEDDLSEDLERLKASLEAEREETLNKSARLLPDKRWVYRDFVKLKCLHVPLISFFFLTELEIATCHINYIFCG